MNKEERKKYNQQWQLTHREHKKEQNCKWRENHKEHIHEYNVTYNKSHQEQVRNNKYKYPYNPEQAQKLRARHNTKLRKEVLTHYGDGKLACVICGENRLLCLSVDHINGGGNKHRKMLGVRAGIPFYQWLRKQGYPLGFRTLCMNCQAVTRL